MGGTCDRHVGDEKLYEMFVRKPEGKRLFSRPSRRWENIEMNSEENNV
jgi:hypothetical protein